MCVCVCVCVKWYYSLYISVNTKNIYIYIYIYMCVCIRVNAKEKKEGWKVDVIFFPSIPRIPPQFVHISYFLWLPQKSICLIFLLLHLKSSSSFFLFLCSSLFFPSCTATSLPSFLTENSSFFKEKIKQLALRFHLQSVWVSKLNLIWFCVFG